MKRFAIFFVFLILTYSIAHADLRQIMKADIVGVWSTGNSYIWLYENQNVKMLSSNCSLIKRGTWKFEIGALKFYEGSKEVAFHQVLKVLTKPIVGSKMVFDTMREWLFMGSDTSMKC